MSMRILFNKVCNIIVWISVSLFAWYFLSVFAFASFKVPTISMLPTLQPGDYIIVNKMAYGARLFDIRKTIRHDDICRLWGYSQPKRNDVMVFNYPYNQGYDTVSFDLMKYYVKRCVALPGDTLEIVDGYYHVRGYNGELGNVESQRMIEKFTREIACMQHSEKINWLNPLLPAIGNWNIRNLGPLYVPKKGDVVKLDTANMSIYKKLIEWEIDANITNVGNFFYAHCDSLLGDYVMKHNYYFMSGDNALNSQDSRQWGLIPEEFIVGRTMIIWKSEDEIKGKVCWNRILHLVE